MASIMHLILMTSPVSKLMRDDEDAFEALALNDRTRWSRIAHAGNRGEANNL